MDNNTVTVEINRQPSFTEIWYEGSVTYEGREFNFWLINPRGMDEQGREYEMEIRWWFKQVPKEIRSMTDQIIKDFKENQHDTRHS